MAENNTQLADETWQRYVWLRDNGHLEYIKKAESCEGGFSGEGQWAKADLDKLKNQQRPALTINKILSTVSTIMGEQIFNRTSIAFRPRNKEATSEVADALTKVNMQISDNNQLAWVRSDVFDDGIVTSRGFYDVRLDFSDSLRGEVRITQVNPKDVLIDSDADSYDPDSWNDVITTRWLSADEIEVLYSKKDADALFTEVKGGTAFDVDAVDIRRDRFGFSVSTGNAPTSVEWSRSTRGIRVIERQWRKMDAAKHFVDLLTGDTRIVPGDWDDEQIAQHLARNENLHLVKRNVRRIRWTVVAGRRVLHDAWSPYRHFTIVPYFPFFRRGSTLGIVEHLLGSQELLNKVSSQELHVVNTTANSGWKVKRDSLVNMSIAELEQRGAQTGLVLELDNIEDAEKIKPNQVPTGLDRIAAKSEAFIDSISGVSRYMKGFAREDVAAKSVVANQQSGQANLAKLRDNLNRTDYLLARATLAIVQEYYTEPRLVQITTDRVQNTTEELEVNEITPEGEILRDLTLGEYGIVITSEPERDTFEDSQFDQAMALRNDAGVGIPDRFLLQASRLRDKEEIIRALEGDPESPEAQQQRRAAQLELAQAELDVALKQEELRRLQTEGATDSAGSDIDLRREEAMAELQLKRDIAEGELALKRSIAAEEAMNARVDKIHEAQPTP